MNVLEEWKSEFRLLESPCPWPGPRPLSPEKDGAKPWRFVGREKEIREFLLAVDDHSLVLLHGESGAGKSSLLNVGLLAVLRRSRFLPLVCNEWRAMDGDDPEAVIAAQLAGSLSDDVIAAMKEDDLTLTEALDEVYDGRAVLILDQFEELIRAQRDEFSAVLDWLLEVNAERRTKVVLSLRSEYFYKLDSFLREVRPFSFTQVKLEPMTDPGDIAAVVTSPNRSGTTAITNGAADRLVRMWLSLPPQSPERSLLYLHATLYALFWDARAAGRTVVEEADLDGLAVYADGMRASGSPDAMLLSAGFDKMIDKKLELCAAACTIAPEDGADGSSPHAASRVLARPPLVAAAKEQIRESVEHLSSGGYKVQQELPDLFLLTAERELNLLTHQPGMAPGTRLTEAEAERLAAAITGRGTEGAPSRDHTRPEPDDPALDLLAASRPDLLALAGVEPPASPEAAATDIIMSGFGVSPPPWTVDRDDVSAGALLGRAPWEPLVEHARAFAFAMEWLREASVIRVSAPFGTAMATLVHDGFGPVLKNWAARNALSPQHAIRALSAFRGERWDWGADETLDGGSGWRTLANLRWRRCEITATFRRLVFVNCDFRATRFVHCTIEGVTFVNCLLDGASFEECTIIGAGASHDTVTPPYMPDGLPQFVLSVDAALLDDFRHYQGDTALGAAVLYSPTSGVAAVPWPEDARPDDAMDVPLSPGGLTMFGGRLSSLMVQGCTFSEGSITLAHIAGSSLDIVEQAEVAMLLSWCAILGLTVSDKVDTHEVDGKVSLTATRCVLANTWFGPNLRGVVDIRSCLVYALTNLSPTLEVVVDDSAHGAVFNATTTTPPQFGLGTPESAANTLETFGPYSRRMAYRSRPAEVELVRRAEAMTEAEPR